MTLQEHISTAKKFKKIRNDLIDMYCVGPKRFRKIYTPESSRLNKVVHLIDEIKSTLDNSYHRLIDEKTFHKLGHIYYGD